MDTSTKAEHLGRIPLFADLPASDLTALAALTSEASFPASRNVVTIGEPGRSLYVIIEGQVRVIYPAKSQEVELARLGPGDFFGEMALLNDEPRSATVRTQIPTRTLVLSTESFREVVRHHPDVALKLLNVLSRRIRNADEQVGGLTEQMLRDPLTGLLNRRAFHERLQEEADRARRYGEQFSLLLLDADHFKSINDTFGHDTGDEVLRWLGRLLIEHTRVADSPFRIGGEEFAIMAPAAGPEVARAVAERILRTVAESRPPTAAQLKVTLSAGYVTCPDHGKNPDLLFHLADQALLQAKEAGRNQLGHPLPPGKG